MSTRPTIAIPSWSTAGTNVEPGAGKKSQGWLVNERPPAEWLNWLQNSAGAWLQFLADATNGSPTPDLKLNFANTDMFAPLLDVTTAPAASGYRLLQRVLVNATQHVNVYAGNTATRRLIFTHNATWGGSSWVCEVAASTASAIALVNNGTSGVLELLWHAATASTWLDSAWTVAGFTNLNTQTLHVTTPDPAVSAVFEGHVLMNAGLNVVTGIDTAGTITVAGAFTSNGSAVFNGDATFNAAHLYLDDDVDIVHTSPQPRRRVHIPLMAGQQVNGSTISANYNYADGYLHTTTGGDRILEYPLHWPREAVNRNVEVLQMSQDASHQNVIEVYRAIRDMTVVASDPPTPELLVSVTCNLYATTFANRFTLVLPGASEPYNESYYVQITLKSNAAGFNRLYAVAATYDDPGARNG